MSMKQVESVIFFVKQVLGDDFRGDAPIKSYITKEQKNEVIELVTTSLLEGETKISDKAQAKYDDRKKMRVYAAGMVENWFNKSRDLNGDVVFQYKNPGSRAGQGDAQLRELKKLRTQLAAAGRSKEDLARVDEAIATRSAEVSASKAKKVEINTDAIPEHLKDLLSA